MAQAQNRKDLPLSMRINASDMAIIDRAARLRGRSRTEFIRDVAVRAAEDTVMECQPIRMSEDGFAAFMAAINGPDEAVPEMVRFMSRPAPWGD